jgi:hypothetical protein
VSAYIYLEGGGTTSDLHVRARAGFRRLLEACGFGGRMPRLVACGGRGATYEQFCIAFLNKKKNDFIIMLIDSEDPMEDIEKTWEHIQKRDGWKKPENAVDEQVLMMATCMETWIVSDHEGLESHYGSELQMSALPSLVDLEQRSRHAIQDALCRATRNCTNAYSKGKRSFEVLERLNPETLSRHLLSFVRMVRILNEKL